MDLKPVIDRIPHLSEEAVLIACYGEDEAAPTIAWCNEALCALSGFAREELVGATTERLHRRDPGGEEVGALRARHERGETTAGTRLTHGRDGTEIWTETRTVPVMSGDGQLVCVVSFRRDVTAHVSQKATLAAEARRIDGERRALEARQAELLRLSLAARSITDAVLILDPDRRIEWANDAYVASCETTLEEVIGRLPEEVRAPVSLRAGEREALGECLARGESAMIEQCYHRKDGTPYWIELSMAPVEDAGMASPGIVAVGRDVTAHKRAKEAQAAALARAEAAERRLWTAIEAIPDGFAIFDADDRLVACNETYRQYYARSGEAIRPGASFLEILEAGLAAGQYPEAAGREAEWLAARLDRHRQASTSIEQRLPDGRWLKVIERRTEFGDTVGFRVDITDLKEQQRRFEDYTLALEMVNLELAEKHAALEISQAEVRHNALHDPLTGLANRRFLDQRLQEEARRGPDRIAVLHVDLDRFKQINDTLGHAAGDAVLVAVADALRAATRATDFVARIGGDEFVVLSTVGSTPDELAGLAERLLARLREPVRFGEDLCRFGASVGIATHGGGQTPIEDLLVRADVALYRAKHGGRNRYEFYSDALHAEIVNRKRISDELLSAIEAGEFVPYYQPQICLHSGRLIGAEALARWQRPDGTVAGPDAFLDVAEYLDLLGSLDRLILEGVLVDLARWEAAGIAAPRIAVNVSARRLRDPGLIAELGGLGVDRRRLTFELLESICLDKVDDQVQWNLDALREMGVRIELDDFGTGYASLVGLLNLRPDGIKIDRQLVAPIVESAATRALVARLTDIGAALGVRVLGEGVETPAHAELLHKVGMNAAQGMLYSAPLPADAFLAHLGDMGGTGAAVPVGR